MSDVLTQALSRVADRFDPKPDPYRDDPSGWVKKRLGEHLWSKQVDIAESVVENRYTVSHAAHGTGKSRIASRLCGWWLDTREDPFVVTTAPTTAQISAILWREIIAMQDEKSLPGRTTLDNEWYIGKKLIAYGRKPADYADPEKAKAAFQGIHARNVLVIIDEAAGIEKWLWEAVDSLLTNDSARVLAIGNPDDPASEFARVCTPGSGWNPIHISAFDLPAFTGERVPREMAEKLTGKQWVEERKEKWGEGTPMYIARVEGLFPDISDDTLITPAMIKRAQVTDIDGFVPGQYGGDVARMGKDMTVVYRNRGGHIRKVAQWAKMDTMTTAGRFKRIMLKTNLAVPMVIDIIGLGAGVFDRLKEQRMPVSPFDSARKVDDRTRRSKDVETYRNVRSMQWWQVRKMFESGEVDIDPRDDDLAAQLVSIKWNTDSSGRIYIEPKKETVKRIGVSPDHADAFMMSTAPVDEWRQFVQERIDELEDGSGDMITAGVLDMQL